MGKRLVSPRGAAAAALTELQLNFRIFAAGRRAVQHTAHIWGRSSGGVLAAAAAGDVGCAVGPADSRSTRCSAAPAEPGRAARAAHRGPGDAGGLPGTGPFVIAAQRRLQPGRARRCISAAVRHEGVLLRRGTRSTG